MQELSIAVGQNGRVVIPANIRQQIGIETGQHLLIRLEGERIILEKTTGILNKLQQRFQNIQGSLSDELIEERRAEAVRESYDS
jgi:AbrB family looped-hinge helix DNA binding protein